MKKAEESPQGHQDLSQDQDLSPCLRVLQRLLLLLPVLGELPEGYHHMLAVGMGNMQSALLRLKTTLKLHVISEKKQDI